MRPTCHLLPSPTFIMGYLRPPAISAMGLQLDTTTIGAIHGPRLPQVGSSRATTRRGRVASTSTQRCVVACMHPWWQILPWSLHLAGEHIVHSWRKQSLNFFLRFIWLGINAPSYHSAMAPASFWWINFAFLGRIAQQSNSDSLACWLAAPDLLLFWFVRS
jgi:hypothetical protein